MSAGTYNFALTEGEDLTLSATWTADTVAVDLTSATAQFIVDTDPPLTVAPTLGGTAGTIAVTIAWATLAAALAGDLKVSYRLLITMGDTTTALLVGSVVVSDD
jgi:hypothetical protein